MIGTFIIRENEFSQARINFSVNSPRPAWLFNVSNIDCSIFTDFSQPFCLEFNSVEELENNFHFLFHKSYLIHNNRIVLFLNSNHEDLSRIRKLLTSQGYHQCLLIHLDNIKEKAYPLTLNMTGKPIKFGVEIKEVQLSVIQKNIVYYDSVLSFKEMMTEYQKLINSDDLLSVLTTCINELYQENNLLSKNLSWTESQLKNHKTYLQILKNLIKNGSDFTGQMPNNKLIRFLKKFGPIRKGGKYLYKKYKSI